MREKFKTKNKKIKKFAKQIKEIYQPEVFLLFGSRAENKELKDSDYDILIVSRKFAGIPFTDRLTKIFKLWPLDKDLECIGLTPEEYENSKTKISLIPKIIERGRSL